MDAHFHSLPDLFHQLGLPNDTAAIDHFIATHRPLAQGVHLADARFWTPSQALFLREALAVDADWAEVVDALSARLNEPGLGH
jgi:hypothetical protein